MANKTSSRRVAELMLSWLDLEVVELVELQTLWAGYGHICAITAQAINEEAGKRVRQACGQSGVGADNSFRLILKLVAPPVTRESLDEGHLRKMLSYEVEQYFYDEIAPGLADDVAVAKTLASTRHMAGRQGAAELAGLTAIIMTDLRTKFTVMGESRGVLSADQVLAALTWLAKFHGTSWKQLSSNRELSEFLLPPMQEAERRRLNPSTGGSRLWLNGGYTYLATRRKEYNSLARDSYSEWCEPFCSVKSGSSKSTAEKVAEFLTPSGRPYETYIHGDVKSENLCTTERGDQVAFFDFQYVGLGLGVCDLAKLFTCSIPVNMLMRKGRIPDALPMDDGEKGLLELYRRELLRHRPDSDDWEYPWEEFVRHWETALVDWCRFQASWGFWGNTEWLEARVRSIVNDDNWLKWLDGEVSER
ncbi:hypothetical protein jhhlp_008485 [Lomentospora prolificans]|uniref:Aminoglycoside phosphotransferase domain-containing protein n=1 Tax=Lomentospora prolificans TaxID=41688 RepID=A0A2N3MY63_9PEZI|nr:hypothetical protein jhhlp_008485 [Lomentospora prolificans]